MQIQKMLLLNEGPSTMPKHKEFFSCLFSCRVVCFLLVQGKSTLSNFLLGQERSITGPEPGLTRDAVHGRLQWEGRQVELVDTAGWMRRSRLHNYDESG